MGGWVGGTYLVRVFDLEERALGLVVVFVEVEPGRGGWVGGRRTKESFLISWVNAMGGVEGERC